MFVNFAAGTKPGFAPVEVLTQDKAFSLGTTIILYLSKDERKKTYQQLVHNKDRQCEFFFEWAASRRDVGGNMSGSSQISSSLGNHYYPYILAIQIIATKKLNSISN